MKSAGGLFPGIVSPDSLRAAMIRAAQGKRARAPVARFLQDADRELATLREELIAGSYRPRPLVQFPICDPKPRLISCADFRDRVVHHAVCAQIVPPIERRMIDDNFACRVGKGSHRAVLRARQFTLRYRYWLRTDIRHYYDRIDHETLMGCLCDLFRESPLRRLLETLVRQPLAGCPPGVGLPIGSLTSQWFANLYLDEIDHWLKDALRMGGYIRYMDDLALWDDSKERLWALAGDLTERLRETRRVETKREATQVGPVAEGMPFLGYRVFPSMVRERATRVRRRHRLLRLREMQCRHGEISEGQLQACVRSMDGPRRFLGFGEPLARRVG